MISDHDNSEVSKGEKETGSVPDFADDSLHDPGLVLPLFTDSAFICKVSIHNVVYAPL